ncbi:MAG: hypothetical protein P8J67_01990 [Flavobacteriaceae bacterium]|jgi:hypothetical protein|nr:hypothetical protein [Flavobacteriaceae bacterium]
MKKLIYLFLAFPLFMGAQDLYWYDVMLEIPRETRESAETLIKDYYSNIDIPSDVNLSFSRIPLKGENVEATHMLSMFSTSAQSLANFRGSLSGEKWNIYTSGMQGLANVTSSMAGNVLVGMNYDKAGPLGQVWIFKVHAKDTGKFVEAFAKLMKTFKPTGLIANGQFTHGNSDGESMFVYGTSKDLTEAFSTGPTNKKEADAFQTFFNEISFAEFSQSQTRVLIKQF